MPLTPSDLLGENPPEPSELKHFFTSLGFKHPEDARKNLKDIAETGTDSAIVEAVTERLLPVFGASVDPDLALSNLDRYARAVEDPARLWSGMADDPALMDLLSWVLGSSSYLAGVLVRHPEYLSALRSGEATAVKTRQAFMEEARRAVSSSAVGRDRMTALHEFQRRELLRIGYRDLAGHGNVTEVTRELSWLADAIVQVAIDEARSDLADELKEPDLSFAVIGVGKLGGEELNFSSDIDIIYIYSDDAHSNDATKLARRVNHYLADRTALGAFYLVDLRLRPNGSRGPLASSMQALKTYYASWGETFERLVLVKARPVAGDNVLGRAFLELVQPFVYRKYLDYAAIDEVRDIKRRIDQQVDSSGELDSNVKLGWGGIREIEFFIQALQVLYGGEMTDLRGATTLPAIEKLHQAGLIEAEVSRKLGDAYAFLRNVEHRLQIVDQRQTHTLPDDENELNRLALRMRMSPEAFGSDLDSHRQEVHAVFNDLFRTSDEGDGETGSAVHRFVNEAMDSESTEAWLASLGFEDAPQAASILESLRDAPAFGHSPSRMKNMLANVISALLESAPQLVRPGKVLTGFERLTSSIGVREVFFRSLLEARESIPRLARLFALSDWLSDTLIQRPGTAEFVIDKERLSRPLDPPFETESRRMFEFYVGIQYLFGVLERERASRLMSSFAETQIARWLPPDGSIALIALGKFGEEELNYRSDLDVMAFFDGDYEESCRLVEELVEGVSGEFSIDLRLRPEGRKGSLVWDLKRTGEYLHSRAEVWERMAWTKARFVAGNPGIAEGFAPLIEEFVYGTEFGNTEIDEMRHIRGRMERERPGRLPECSISSWVEVALLTWSFSRNLFRFEKVFGFQILPACWPMQVSPKRCSRTTVFYGMSNPCSGYGRACRAAGSKKRTFPRSKPCWDFLISKRPTLKLPPVSGKHLIVIPDKVYNDRTG